MHSTFWVPEARTATYKWYWPMSLSFDSITKWKMLWSMSLQSSRVFYQVRKNPLRFIGNPPLDCFSSVHDSFRSHILKDRRPLKISRCHVKHCSIVFDCQTFIWEVSSCAVLIWWCTISKEVEKVQANRRFLLCLGRIDVEQTGLVRDKTFSWISATRSELCLMLRLDTKRCER
jgi:hypothetical protein